MVTDDEAAEAGAASGRFSEAHAKLFTEPQHGRRVPLRQPVHVGAPALDTVVQDLGLAERHPAAAAAHPGLHPAVPLGPAQLHLLRAGPGGPAGGGGGGGGGGIVVPGAGRLYPGHTPYRHLPSYLQSRVATGAADE